MDGREAASGRPLLFRSYPLKTNVYIDGFNLFYGALRHTPYKWLDLNALCEKMLPKNVINRIHYFTARVTDPPWDPYKSARQDAYLRALATFPNITIHEGRFLSNVVKMPLAYPPSGGPYKVDVLKTEEKGSDVKLATALLVDAFNQDCDVAVVITNDSDLEEPIVVVNKLWGIPVGILNPHRYPSRELQKAASFYKPIRVGVLRTSQLPDPVIGPAGVISKPSGW